jgi:tRNA nucleotidyltransferase/poly(A) polymerase
MQISTNISLNSDEQEVFSVIKEVVNKYTPTTRPYAVGGWTRDKLLQIKSDDIDIMLSNISGEDFAKLVTRYMNIKDPHVIKENPEKSKHITTAKTYIPLSSGKIQEIDFAQARKEVYKEDSRIPEIKPATPEEDAYRRDFTINAIFYDIIEGKVVDFTGRGIKDLMSNTIRTPMDPLKTFSEDPLRILRAIRFSAKYNAPIDPKTYEAMKNPQLRDEIKQKISKERIGQEFIKMLKNPNAQHAIQLLKDTGLLEDIISEALKGTLYEGKMAQFDMSQENPHHKLTLWSHSMEVVKNIIEKYKEAEPEKKIAITLAALMHDIGKLYQDVWGQSKSHPGYRSYHGHEDESAKIVNLILKYLKIEPYIDQVAGLAQTHMKPHQLLRDEGGMRALRKFIRIMGEKSLNWLDVFNLALADAYAKDIIRDPTITQEYQSLQNRLEEALTTMTPIKDRSIDKSIKPILNGNEIMQILNTKQGPHLKEITEFIKDLMDENPNITKEEAAQKLIEKYNNIVPKATKQAGSEKEEKKEFTTCPMHLLRTKIDEMKKLMAEKKYYEAFSVLSQLQEQYPNDERVNRMIALYTFRLLLISEKYRSSDILQHIFDKAEANFFDSALCSYVFGILVLLETKTEQETICEIGNRVAKMSPDIFKTILDSLSNIKVYHPEILKAFKEKIK